MHRSLCICALLPRLETRTRVLFVIHQLEANKPTNTGLVAARCLPNSAVLYRGRAPAEGGEFALPALPTVTSAARDEMPDAQRLILYPHPSATPLTEWRGHGGPIALLVPDGTWRQASRARSRLAPDAREIPCVSLPVSTDRKRMRFAAAPERLATMEAVAHALGILEGPEVEAELLRVYRIMTERTLWTNGRIDAADVTGGIPAGVQSHDPLSARRAG
jgi:DTW domain-containing protein YfiP